MSDLERFVQSVLAALGRAMAKVLEPVAQAVQAVGNAVATILLPTTGGEPQ